MKVLVAVASKHGSTREIAEAIVKELVEQGIAADLRDLNQPGEPDNIDGYDAVVLGSAIYAGNWLPEAKNFAGRYRAQLSVMPLWLFSSGPLGAENPQPQDDPARLAAPLLLPNALDHHVFVGRLDEHDLGFAERLMTKMVKAPYGDFRDWDEIRAWAGGISQVLRTAGVVAGH